MDFNKIKEMGLEYAEKGRNAAMDLAERGRTQAKIVSEQTKLARAQRQLGALVYSLAKGNEENQPLVDKYIEMISSIEANLNALKESLGPAAEVITHDLDEEPAEGIGITIEPTVEKDKKPDTDKKTCPQCGAPVSEDALFCNAAHSCNSKALKGRCPRRGMPPFLHRNRAKCENSGNN